MLKHKKAILAFVLIPLFAQIARAMPETLPPIFAMGKAAKAAGPEGEIRVTLRCPQVSWQTIEKQRDGIKRMRWSEIKTDVRERTLTLEFNTPSQIPDSRVTRLDGKPVPLAEMAELLKNETAVLVSPTGKRIDPYYHAFLNPDTLVFILARDEGMGDPSLLNRQKAFDIDPAKSVSRFIMPHSAYEGIDDLTILALHEDEKTAKNFLKDWPLMIEDIAALQQNARFQYLVPGGIVNARVRVFATADQARRELEERFAEIGSILEMKPLEAGDKAYIGDRISLVVQENVWLLLQPEEESKVDLENLSKAYADWLKAK